MCKNWTFNDSLISTFKFLRNDLMYSKIALLIQSSFTQLYIHLITTENRD